MATENLNRTVEVDGTTYDVELKVAEEGGYNVRVPSLPGCNTAGDNLDEAMAMAKDAIQAMLAAARAHGEQ